MEELKTRVAKVFRHEPVATGVPALQWRASHMFFGLFTAVVISCLLLSTDYLNTETAFMLIIFNFLFVSLTFPLNALFVAKMLLLVLGNFIGLVWSCLFSLFANAVANYALGLFNVLYLLFGPLGNMIWIVTFYSVSLTFLSSLHVDEQRREFDS